MGQVNQIRDRRPVAVLDTSVALGWTSLGDWADFRG